MALAQGIPYNSLFKMYILQPKEDYSLTIITWYFLSVFVGGKSQYDLLPL